MYPKYRDVSEDIAYGITSNTNRKHEKYNFLESNTAEYLLSINNVRNSKYRPYKNVIKKRNVFSLTEIMYRQRNTYKSWIYGLHTLLPHSRKQLQSEAQ